MNEFDIAEMAAIRVVDDTPDNLVPMSNLPKDDYKVKVANSSVKAGFCRYITKSIKVTEFVEALEFAGKKPAGA